MSLHLQRISFRETDRFLLGECLEGLGEKNMRKFVFLAAAAAAAVILSGPLYAQAPVQLPEEALERLNSGGRANVIVMLSEPSVSAETAAMSDQALMDRAEIVRALQEDIIQDAIGLPLAQLERTRSEFFQSLADVPAMSDDEAEAAAAQSSPLLQRAFRYTPALAMTLNASQIEALAAHPGVVRIVDNSPQFLQMDESLIQIGAHIVHDAGITGAGQAVAIFDSGVDFEHPMTGPAIIGSACFSTSIPEDNFWSQCENGQPVVTGGRAGDPCETCRFPSNHGTHVGGTVAGRPFVIDDNGTQRTLQGVAPEAYLIAVNVFGDYVPDQRLATIPSDQLAALEWIIDNPTFPDPQGGDPIPVAAINMSLGGGSFADFCDTNPLAPAIVYLRSRGIATVIASGNNGFNTTVSGPSCIGAAITVGAVERSDAVADFSNSNFIVDLLAPGVGIRSARMTFQGSAPDWAPDTGTSMATPHVAGAFALLRGAFPQATVDQIEFALKSTGRPSTDPDNSVTRPVIQVHSAYDYLVRQFELTGPLTIAPTTHYYATVDLNRPEDPDVVTYQITNTTGSDVNFIVQAQSNDAITFGGGVRSFESIVPAGSTFDLNIEVDLAAVELGSTTGQIVITAETGGRPQVIRIRATTVGYVGPAPTQRPINDNFADALPIPDAFAIYQVSTYGATTQIAEPDHAGGDNGGSIWYSMRAERPGQVELSMQGRQGANTIAVYSGNSIAALQEVASASATSETVTLTFDPTEGQTYRIALDYNPPANTFGEQQSTPVGFRVVPMAADYDNFATPFDLDADGGIAIVSFGGSTVEPSEPYPPQSPDTGTLWLRADGPEGQTLSFSVISVSDGVSIEAFSGNALDNLQSLGNEFYTSLSAGEPFTVTIPAGGLYLRATPAVFGDGIANHSEIAFSWNIEAQPSLARLSTAIAPMVRTVTPEQFTSALVAASVNPTGPDARTCGVIPPQRYPGPFVSQALSANGGNDGQAVDIPAGQSRIYAFGTRWSSTAVPVNAFVGLARIPLTIACENGAATSPTALNTLLLSVSDTPLPDIIVSTALTSGNAVELAPDGAARFSAAAVNVGAVSESIIAYPVAIAEGFDTSFVVAASDALFALAAGVDPVHPLPLGLSICESDPATGVCYGDFSSSVTLSNLPANQNRTFVVRVAGQGESIDFQPRSHRIGIAFVAVSYFDGTVIDVQTPRLVGAATVAVRTTPQN